MTAGSLSMSCTQGQAFSLNISIVNPDNLLGFSNASEKIKVVFYGVN